MLRRTALDHAIGCHVEDLEKCIRRDQPPVTFTDVIEAVFGVDEEEVPPPDEDEA